MKGLFDTHCHLDAPEFDLDRDIVAAQAAEVGVQGILLPAVHADGFEGIRALAHRLPNAVYAVGIHPMYVRQSSQRDLVRLEAFVGDHLDDPRLVAIGEIGLDFFVPDIREGIERERQIEFYCAQLALAERVGLPVLLHVRRSQDELLKWLRRRARIGGIAHAFNGSDQQADQFMSLGFALGMGGAMTFTRARQIRRLAARVSLEHLVLETDSPDIAPAWLGKGQRNTPAQVLPIAQTLADLRGTSLQQVVAQTAATAFRVIPRLKEVLQP